MQEHFVNLMVFMCLACLCDPLRLLFLPSFRIVCLCQVPGGDSSALFPSLALVLVLCTNICIILFPSFCSLKMYHFIMKHMPGKWTYTNNHYFDKMYTKNQHGYFLNIYQGIKFIHSAIHSEILLEHLMCAWCFWILGMQWWTKEGNVQPRSSGETSTQPISDILSVRPVLWRW